MYLCKIIKSFQGLPKGATVTLTNQGYEKRIKAKEVELIKEVTEKEMDESMYEDDGIHSDNAHNYIREEEDKLIDKNKNK